MEPDKEEASQRELLEITRAKINETTMQFHKRITSLEGRVKELEARLKVVR